MFSVCRETLEAEAEQLWVLFCPSSAVRGRTPVRLWRTGEDRGNTRYKRARKGRPTEPGPGTREGFLKPFCVIRRIKHSLESTSCFLQRGNRLQLIAPSITDKGAETAQSELMRSHERAAYFCWAQTHTGMTLGEGTPDAPGAGQGPVWTPVGVRSVKAITPLSQS